MKMIDDGLEEKAQKLKTLAEKGHKQSHALTFYICKQMSSFVVEIESSFQKLLLLATFA